MMMYWVLYLTPENVVSWIRAPEHEGMVVGVFEIFFRGECWRTLSDLVGLCQAAPAQLY